MRNPQSLPVKDEPYQPLQIATIQQNTHYTFYAAKIQKVTINRVFFFNFFLTFKGRGSRD